MAILHKLLKGLLYSEGIHGRQLMMGLHGEKAVAHIGRPASGGGFLQNNDRGSRLCGLHRRSLAGRAAANDDDISLDLTHVRSPP